LFVVKVPAELAMRPEHFAELNSAERTSVDVRMMELGMKTKSPVGIGILLQRQNVSATVENYFFYKQARRGRWPWKTP
jgi:hypothetical protein